MIFDSGLVTVCTLLNTAEPGEMPKEALSPVLSAYYGERIVGYGRYYEARGVNEQVDMLIRIWRTTAARIGMYAAYLYRKRADDAPVMPRMLRYALNNRLFSQKVREAT